MTTGCDATRRAVRWRRPRLVKNVLFSILFVRKTRTLTVRTLSATDRASVSSFWGTAAAQVHPIIPRRRGAPLSLRGLDRRIRHNPPACDVDDDEHDADAKIAAYAQPDLSSDIQLLKPAKSTVLGGLVSSGLQHLGQSHPRTKGRRHV